jgi:hypothetical protein
MLLPTEGAPDAPPLPPELAILPPPPPAPLQAHTDATRQTVHSREESSESLPKELPPSFCLTGGGGDDHLPPEPLMLLPGAMKLLLLMILPPAGAGGGAVGFDAGGMVLLPPCACGAGRCI